MKKLLSLIYSPHSSVLPWIMCFFLGLLAWVVLAGGQAVPLAQSKAQVGLAAQPEPIPMQAEGLLVPRHSVTLSLPDGARAAEVLVKEGQQVSAGDILVRLDGYEVQAARVANSEMELVLARQKLDNLYDEANLKLAQVELALAETSKEQALAADHLESLSRPRPQWHIDQAYANLRLAEDQLTNARQDLDKAQKKFANKKNFIWRFINQRKFKLRITLLEQQVAIHERKYQDAQEKCADLLAGPDPIDLELAQARLEDVNANLSRLQQERQDLQNGPDPDELQAAQARLQAALTRLEAEKVALNSTELKTPIDGVVVELNAKQGQWMPAGRPVVYVADLNEWTVETTDLEELLVPVIHQGQPVRLYFDAIPDLSLEGQVDSIDLLYTEDDEEIFYTADIHTAQNDPRLRWGMTVRVEFIQPDTQG